jgi:hypothetical protein
VDYWAWWDGRFAPVCQRTPSNDCFEEIPMAEIGLVHIFSVAE